MIFNYEGFLAFYSLTLYNQFVFLRVGFDVLWKLYVQHVLIGTAMYCHRLEPSVTKSNVSVVFREIVVPSKMLTTLGSSPSATLNAVLANEITRSGRENCSNNRITCYKQRGINKEE